MVSGGAVFFYSAGADGNPCAGNCAWRRGNQGDVHYDAGMGFLFCAAALCQCDGFLDAETEKQRHLQEVKVSSRQQKAVPQGQDGIPVPFFVEDGADRSCDSMCGGGSRFKERYGMECFVCDWYFACVSAFLRMALALYELSLFRFKDPFSVCVATDIIEKIGMIGKKFRLLPFIFATIILH